jgi:hypothetical protein
MKSPDATTQMRRRPQHRHQQGGTIINILTAVVFFGLIAAGILWIMKTAGEAGEQYATAMVDTQNRATSLSCQMNLRAIGQNLQMYAVGNEGFPDSLEALVSWTGDSRVMRCPDPNGGEYIYIPGVRADDAAPRVLVYEPTPVHDGKHNVLFANGQIGSLTPDQLKMAVEATIADRR